VAFRQSFETCPRCQAALEDAGAVRACTGCRGQWVLEPVLAEMVIAMLPPGVLGKLVLAPTSGKRTGPCPSCGIAMASVSLHGVELERCPKDHGVWFDPGELQAGLLRSAAPGASPTDAPADRIEPLTSTAPSAPLAPPSEPVSEPPPPIIERAMSSTKLADVIARMKRGETFTIGVSRAFDTYGWDPLTGSLYQYYQEDTFEHPRSSLSESELAELIARAPHRFA